MKNLLLDIQLCFGNDGLSGINDFSVVVYITSHNTMLINMKIIIKNNVHK